MDVISPPPTPPHHPPHDRTAPHHQTAQEDEENKKKKHLPHLPRPHRTTKQHKKIQKNHRAQKRKRTASRSRHVQKVERWPKHCKKRWKCDRHRKHRKTRCERMRRACCWTVQCAKCGLFFVENTANTDAKTKTQIFCPRAKVPKLEFQHMPAKKSHHPTRRQTHVLPTTTTSTESFF